MKKALLSFSLMISVQLLFAQFVSSGTNLYNNNSGNVGIGNGTLFNAQFKFQVYDNSGVGITGVAVDPGSTIFANPTLLAVKSGIGSNGFIIRSQATDSYRGQSALFLNFSNGQGNGFISMMSNAIDIRTGVNYTDNITNGSFGTSAMYINNLQQVGIGTTNPGTNKLAVEGTIGARAVKVTLQNPWPDYVFNTGYTLPSLKTLEAYIQVNSHLPGLPSAAEVEKTGVDLGSTQARLLEKVEELTLYAIQLEKRVDQLTEENKKIEDLRQQMDELKKALKK